MQRKLCPLDALSAQCPSHDFKDTNVTMRAYSYEFQTFSPAKYKETYHFLVVSAQDPPPSPNIGIESNMNTF